MAVTPQEFFDRSMGGDRDPGHEFLAEADPTWLWAYQEYALRMYGREDNLVPRQWRELIVLALLAAQGSWDPFRLHLRRALKNGMSPRRVLQTLEVASVTAGMAALATGAALVAGEVAALNLAVDEPGEQPLRDFLDASSQRLFNDGDTDFVDEIMPPDFIDHDPLPGQPAGPEGTKWKIQALHTAFPDFTCRNEFVLADEEQGLAAHMYVATGTNAGPYLGSPPTGRKVTLAGIDVLRIQGRRFLERWGQTDNLATMRQLGLLPEQNW
jgi:alkylhydroperoxidase/carboxymuconolactone decarboxylase family protein YurZ/predicted ester cyclase